VASCAGKDIGVDNTKSSNANQRIVVRTGITSFKVKDARFVPRGR